MSGSPASGKPSVQSIAQQRYQALCQTGHKLGRNIHAAGAYGAKDVEGRLVRESQVMSQTLGRMQDVSFHVRRSNEALTVLADRLETTGQRRLFGAPPAASQAPEAAEQSKAGE